MNKAIDYARLLTVVLAVIVAGLVLSCGGGAKRSMTSLPALSGSSPSVSSGNVDRTASIPEGDISRLDPVVQQLYAAPGAGNTGTAPTCIQHRGYNRTGG
jgi:hypothetical protein